MSVSAAPLMPATSASAAVSFLSTDRAIPTVTVNVGEDLAEALLVARGWQIDRHDAESARPARGYMIGMRRSVIAPDGTRFWDLDEALTIAMTAEALAMAPYIQL